MSTTVVDTSIRRILVDAIADAIAEPARAGYVGDLLAHMFGDGALRLDLQAEIAAARSKALAGPIPWCACEMCEEFDPPPALAVPLLCDWCAAPVVDAYDGGPERCPRCTADQDLTGQEVHR